MNQTSIPATSAAVANAPYEQKSSRGARIIFSRIFAVAVAATLIMGRSRWEKPDAMAPEVMLLLGLVLATLAMAGRMWCSLFIAGRKNAELVTHGPYALCRNPLYLFSLIGAVGVGLASGMASVALALGLSFALYYPTVIRREEACLRRLHGVRFTTYAQSVPCFWPRWRKNREACPQSIECHSRVFLQHLASALWFPILCGLVYVVSALRTQCKDWPVWFVLP